MKGKYILAVRIRNGKIEKYKCEVCFENIGQNKICIKGLYGKDRKYWFKYNTPFRGFYLIWEQELKEFLRSELQNHIDEQNERIKQCNELINIYKEELSKISD